MKLFDKNIDLYQKAMDMRVKRQELISSNLANRETPGYVAKDIVFEKALMEAYNSDKAGTMKTTRSGHTNGTEFNDINQINGEVIHSFNPDPRSDGNTVDLDKENMKMVENTIQYNALVKLASHKFGLLKTVISERS